MKIKFVFLFLLAMIIVISACDIYKSTSTKQAEKEPQTVDTSEDMPPISTEIETTLPETEKPIPNKSINKTLEGAGKPEIKKLHWTRMPLAYNIHNRGHMLRDCSRYEANKIKKGY